LRTAAIVGSAVIAILVAGCGSRDGSRVLANTASNLASIRSGQLAVSLRIDLRGGQSFRFELRGPFRFLEGLRLPVARIAYTTISGGSRVNGTLISNGRQVVVRVGRKARRLTEAELDRLRAATRSIHEGGDGLRTRIVDLFESPQLARRSEVGGAATEHVHAALDVPAALDELVELGNRLFGEPLLSPQSRTQVEPAMRSATVDVYSGENDHVLRKLRIEVKFGIDVPDAVAEALGGVVGGTASAELEIVHPNSAVLVGR